VEHSLSLRVRLVPGTTPASVLVGIVEGVRPAREFGNRVRRQQRRDDERRQQVAECEAPYPHADARFTPAVGKAAAGGLTFVGH